MKCVAKMYFLSSQEVRPLSMGQESRDDEQLLHFVTDTIRELSVDFYEPDSSDYLLPVVFTYSEMLLDYQELGLYLLCGTKLVTSLHEICAAPLLLTKNLFICCLLMLVPLFLAQPTKAYNAFPAIWDCKILYSRQAISAPLVHCILHSYRFPPHTLHRFKHK